MPLQDSVVVNCRVYIVPGLLLVNFPQFQPPIGHFRIFLSTGSSNWCYVSGVLPDWHSYPSVHQSEGSCKKIPEIIIVTSFQSILVKVI